jgi:hypothetical protein
LSAPLIRIPVGIVVERSKAVTRWDDYLWKPVAALPGEPATAPWTQLSGDDTRASFYAGTAEVELYRSETTNYRDNLTSLAPSLWVVLRRADATPPYQLYLVTADPAEGEAMTQAGNDIVEPVPMPPSVHDAIAAFIAEHHVERVVIKRQRERANPESLGRRPPATRMDD